MRGATYFFSYGRHRSTTTRRLLIYLGRKDDMVKVRGNRVTLTEAESWLLKVSGVAQAAIKAFPTPSGDNRLVG